MKRSTATVMLLVAVLTATVRPPMAHGEGAEVAAMREDLDEVVTLSARLMKEFGQRDTRALVLEARGLFRDMPEDDAEKIAAAAPLIGEWRRSLTQVLGEVKRARKMASTRSSAGYPTSVDYPTVCSVEIYPAGLLAALVVKNVAEAALAAAEYFCTQTIPVPLIGGCISTASACTGLSIVASVANIGFELSSFCAAERYGSRLSSADERLVHLHADMESRDTTQAAAFTSLRGQLDGVQSNLTSRANSLDAQVVTMRNTLTTRSNSIDSSIASARATLDQEQATTLVLGRRLEIERVLSEQRQQDVVSLILPASGGGDLDLVRQIVSETIAKFQSAGLQIDQAQNYYNAGVAAQGSLQYREAFRQFALAYQQCVRGSK